MKILRQLLVAIIFIALFIFSALEEQEKKGERSVTPLPQSSSISKKINISKVADGDTVTGWVDNKKTRIRLSGIDTPELHQSFGEESRTRLSQLTSKGAYFRYREKDRYQRTVASLYSNKPTASNQTTTNDIGLKLVSEGLAWCITRRDSFANTCEELRKEAKSKQIGLWSQRNPTPPWHWRKQNPR